MKPASNSLRAVWLAALLGVAAFLTGCAGVVPLPVSSTKVERGQRLTPSQVAFIQPGQTTRAEVISQLGTNYLSLPKGRAIAYSWEMAGGGGVWWWIVVLPYAGGAGDAGHWTGGWRAFFVAFDDRGKVTATAFRKPSTRHSLHEHLGDWVKESRIQRQVASSR